MRHRHVEAGSGGRLRFVWLAILLGASAGLFVHGYWLIDFFPPESRQLLAVTAIAGLAACAVYFPLLQWIGRCFHTLRTKQRVVLALASPLLGAFLLFAGTDQWLDTGRYVTFLLPRHELHLSIAPSTGIRGTALVWFHTSMGDVSFDGLALKGWERRADELILDETAANALEWVGITGERVQLVFRSGHANPELHVTWDDVAESASLSGRKTTYDHAFPVPFYASRTLIVLFGLLNFSFLSLAFLMYFSARRAAWVPEIRKSAIEMPRALKSPDVLVVAGAIGVALLLRAFNLGRLFPAVDEYYHLIAARQIVEGAALGSVYPRGLWIVTMPVTIALRVFGHELGAARLVGVLFNAVAVVPLYLLGRKMNRAIAIGACVLYATSPWIITFARVAREYAYYPFYFYWIIYGMLVLVEAIPAGCVVARDWRLLLTPKIVVLGAALALPPVFALAVDWLSTFRTILIAYLVFGVFVLARFDWKSASNWPVLAVLGVILAAAGHSWYLEQSTKLLVVPRLNPVPLQYFFPNPAQQWYFDRAAILAALAVAVAIMAAYLLRAHNFVPLFMAALFLSYLAVFSFVSKSFFHTRHLLTTQLWYVVVMAVGAYWLWAAFLAAIPWRNRALRVLLGLGVGLSTINVPQILLPSLSSDPDMRISEDYLHEMSEIQGFMLTHAQPGDVLISTVYGLYAAWEGVPKFQAAYRITSQTPEDAIAEIVEQHEAGWIVIDQIRLDLSGMSARDFAKIPQIEYIGVFGDEHVWRW